MKQNNFCSLLKELSEIGYGDGKQFDPSEVEFVLGNGSTVTEGQPFQKLATAYNRRGDVRTADFYDPELKGWYNFF